MERWYVLASAPGKEEEAAGLLENTVDHRYWVCQAIPKKAKVFRSHGVLHVMTDVMFPGYVFIKTESPEELAGELFKSRELPHFIDCGTERFHPGERGRGRCAGWIQATDEALKKGKKPVPVEEADLAFLKHVCGENLRSVMGVTCVTLNRENQIIRAEGILEAYVDRIVKLNLHKRFAVVELPLFNRNQSILFGIRLLQDQAG